jgi:hypothetical protein
MRVPTRNRRKRQVPLFQSEVAPTLRELIPSRPLVSQLAAKEFVS